MATEHFCTIVSRQIETFTKSNTTTMTIMMMMMYIYLQANDVDKQETDEHSR